MFLSFAPTCGKQRVRKPGPERPRPTSFPPSRAPRTKERAGPENAMRHAVKHPVSPVLSSLLLCLLVLPGAPARAALERVAAPVTPEKAANPQPEARDVILPMPCGLSMVLRAVAVPGTLLQDRRFTMGIAAADPTRQLYERRFEGRIAAPFTIADLPAAWLQRLDPGTADGYTFYFLGKYEVSQWQWDAVMNESCPAEAPAGADLPKRELSWFDAQDFLRRYNAWLVRNHPDSLPRFAGNDRNIGFLRLPTEEEWEFAARGGHRVREEDRDNNDIFPLGGARLEDFGVFTSETPVHAPLPIGSRRPNPLGLHDTVGNVKEMTDGFFRLSVADMRADGEVYRRLHGAAGGTVIKGGGFRSRAGEVLPGWRDEAPLYTATGELRPGDLGFRVALSGLNVPSGQRMLALTRESAEWEKEKTAAAPARPEKPAQPTQPAQPSQPPQAAPQAPAPPPEAAAPERLPPPAHDPLVELDNLAQVASPDLRTRLTQLRGVLAERQSAQERQRAEGLENTARALLYQAETIRGFAFRYFMVHDTLKKFREENKGKDTSEAEKMARGRLDEYFQLILTAANYYKSALGRVAGASGQEVGRIMNQFRQEYDAGDSLSRHMKENIATVEKHLRSVRTQGIDRLDRKRVCRDIIPDAHRQVLPLK